ncbi:MAG: hypothetical protein J0H29_03545 [Sphingobacteriales bacterium]|nr:hypothetical protein [Sphingobacteriales bacterium]OJY87235.1 MAG: hypothetical protein BGP14_08965 [Sphingobacteriales bacterium 44-15]
MGKFTFFFLIAFTMIFVANAQIQKGTTVLGGNIGFSTQKYDPGSGGIVTTNQNFNVMPLFAKAIKQNFIVGGDITYGKYLNKQTSPSSAVYKTDNNSYGIGAFIRGYKNLGSSGFYLFLQSRLGASVTDGKSNYTGNPGPATKNDNNGFDIRLNLYPGVSYAVTPKMHIETGLNDLFQVGYNSSKSSGSQIPETKSSGFSAGIGLGSSTIWTVGVKFLFGA